MREQFLFRACRLFPQGSLLLGSVTRAVLGEGALHSATAQIHPFLIAGWCGIVGTALNCLPVGCIDGGRMMQVTILCFFSPFFPLLFSPLRHQPICLPPATFLAPGCVPQVGVSS